MYQENKLLSIALSIVILLLIIGIVFMNYVINNNKKAITFFNIEDFKNVSYSNNNGDKFEIKDNKLYITFDGDNVGEGIKYRFDDKTGEIQYNGNEHQLYVKSVGRTNITLWYKYKIFVLDKDIVAN